MRLFVNKVLNKTKNDISVKKQTMRDSCGFHGFKALKWLTL
jgi:hypothetical protein